MSSRQSLSHSHTSSEGSILHQFANLGSIKNTYFKFFHAQTRKGFSGIIETIIIFIKSLHRLFYQTQLYVKRRQDNAIPVKQWLIYEVFYRPLQDLLVPANPSLPSANQQRDCPNNRKNKDVWCSHCCPNKKLTILKSTHMAQLCLV